MNFINKFETTEEFNNVKNQLQELEHYLVYDEETDEIYLKMPPEKSYILNYKITQVVNEIAQNFGGKISLISRCDLFKSIKVDGVEQDLSGKARIPYEFKKETVEEIGQELYSLISTLIEGEERETWNEEYVLTTSELTEDKEGTIEVVWQDNIPLKSFIGCMFYNMCITSIPNDMFINKQFINLMGMFAQCASLTSLDLSSSDTSQVTNMNSMFAGCLFLSSLDLSSSDTSQVTDMNSMFAGCSSLSSLNLSKLNTNKVTTMKAMFSGCYKLPSLDLSNFNTSQVTDMNSMFYSCSSLTSLDLSNFDISKVTDMNNMFRGCNALSYIKCKQLFKDWCIEHQGAIDLPQALIDGTVGSIGSGCNWEITDYVEG